MSEPLRKGNYAELKHNEAKGQFEAWYKGVLISKGRSREYIMMHINGGSSVKAKKMNVVGVTENGNIITPAGETVTVTRAANPLSITKRFQFLAKYTDMCIEGEIASLIVTGEGGLGKTHTVLARLEAAGLKDIRDFAEQNLELHGEICEEGEYCSSDFMDSMAGDYIVFKGASSAKGLYRALYENRNKTVIFDDCDSVLKIADAVSILKSALDSYDKRIISWNTEVASGDNLPRFFEFTGRCIFISNMPQYKLDQAIKSRSLRIDLSMTADEKIERMTQILPNIAPKYSVKIKQEALKFISQHKDEATDLNIRTLLSVIKIAATGDKDWKEMALYSLAA